jgi:hypothetical protein
MSVEGQCIAVYPHTLRSERSVEGTPAAVHACSMPSAKPSEREYVCKQGQHEY